MTSSRFSEFDKSGLFYSKGITTNLMLK